MGTPCFNLGSFLKERLVSLKTRRNKNVIRRWIDEGWNEGKVHMAFAVYAPEFTARDHEDYSKVISGPEGMGDFVDDFRRKHPGIRIEILELIADGDRVAGLFLVRMKDENGRLAEYHAMDVWLFNKDGMITARLYAAPLVKLK